ncbi:MAG: hypothetical protein J6A59_18485 [Lachnospiraceae bacterium]|nr:hypothetical protein [Lachnospiraceae bacterium]
MKLKRILGVLILSTFLIGCGKQELINDKVVTVEATVNNAEKSNKNEISTLVKEEKKEQNKNDTVAKKEESFELKYDIPDGYIKEEDGVFIKDNLACITYTINKFSSLEEIEQLDVASLGLAIEQELVSAYEDTTVQVISAGVKQTETVDIYVFEYDITLFDTTYRHVQLNTYDIKNKEQHIITFTDVKNTKNYEEFMDSIEKIVISK